MLAQAQQMMSNPAMAQQAQQAMSSLSPEEMRARIAAAGVGAGAAAPALGYVAL